MSHSTASDVGAQNLLEDLIRQARKAGADAADALAFESASLSVARRLGNPERLERAESSDLGLRILIGKRQAIVSTSDRRPASLKALVERAVAMARVVPEDPYCGLAPDELLATAIPDLDLCDPAEPQVETLIESANRAEETALGLAGITNSEGAEAGWSRSDVVLAASNGFSGAYAVSRHSLSVSVVAGEGVGMERDYDFTSAVYASDLDSPEKIGRRAAERALKRLNPRKGSTKRLPVVFDPRVSNGMVRNLAGAISGSSISRGTSFLKDRMGEQIFATGITIVDDPFKARGLRSKPFDGEGVAPAARTVIDHGKLTTWLLDLRSARQLGLETTGHASRGTSSPPSPAPTNLYMEAGARSPAELIADIEEGLYVTEMMGSGGNLITGDYSRGAAGYWIERGELVYPVSEMTVAGNLADIFRNMEPANDLEFRYGVDAPTIRVEGLTVAGR